MIEAIAVIAFLIIAISVAVLIAHIIYSDIQERKSNRK